MWRKRLPRGLAQVMAMPEVNQMTLGEWLDEYASPLVRKNLDNPRGRAIVVDVEQMSIALLQGYKVNYAGVQQDFANRIDE